MMSNDQIILHYSCCALRKFTHSMRAFPWRRLLDCGHGWEGKTQPHIRSGQRYAYEYEFE